MQKRLQRGLILTKLTVRENEKSASTNKFGQIFPQKFIFEQREKLNQGRKTPGVYGLWKPVFSPQSGLGPFNAQVGSAHTAPIHLDETAH